MTWLSLEVNGMTSNICVTHIREAAKKDEIINFTEFCWKVYRTKSG